MLSHLKNAKIQHLKNGTKLPKKYQPLTGIMMAMNVDKNDEGNDANETESDDSGLEIVPAAAAAQTVSEVDDM